MTVYKHDYKKTLLMALSLFRYSMDAFHPPENSDDITQLSVAVDTLAGIAEYTMEQAKDQPIKDQEACVNIATLIGNLSETIKSMM